MLRVVLVCVAALLPSKMVAAFEPGSLGEDYRDLGYVQGCTDTGELPGCTIISGGSQFVATADGPTPADVMAQMRDMPKLGWVEFRGDLLETFDSYSTIALGTVAVAGAPDPYADIVAAMQGRWVSAEDPLATVEVDGLIWSDSYDGAEVARSVVFVGEDCAQGPIGGPVVELFQTGSAEMDSLCYSVVGIADDRMELVYTARGNTLVFARP